MKKIATIQYVIAWICVLLFTLPSMYLFSAGIESFFKQLDAVLYVLGTVGVWWYGLWLLRSYGRIMAGRLSATQTQSVWLASLAFNAVGLLIGAIGLSGERSLEAYLVLIPALTGTVLAFVALLLPADQTSRLETKTRAHS
jgi:hypothetical protein